MQVTTFVFVGLLFAEFIALIFGFSVMFRQVNVLQILLHGLGVLALVWMILDRWHYALFDVIAGLFAFIPFLMELAVICAAHERFKLLNNMQTKFEREKREKKPEAK
jgi:hypothetical protein